MKIQNIFLGLLVLTGIIGIIFIVLKNTIWKTSEVTITSIQNPSGKNVNTNEENMEKTVILASTDSDLVSEEADLTASISVSTENKITTVGVLDPQTGYRVYNDPLILDTIRAPPEGSVNFNLGNNTLLKKGMKINVACESCNQNKD